MSEDTGSATIVDEEGHVPSAAESTQVVAAIVEQSARPGLRTRLAENPTLVLCVVVLVLYAVTAWKDDSLLTQPGIRSILLLACPLAIFAASQTLCMLTGGIDLSVAMTANLAAYVAATQSDRGAWIAIGLALSVGLAVGFVNGIAIGAMKVNPLIMTLGMASVLLGVVTVGIRGWLSGSTNVLSIVREVGSQPLTDFLPKNIIVWAVVVGRADPRPALGRPRTGDLRRGRQPDRLPPGRRAHLAGAPRRVRALRAARRPRRSALLRNHRLRRPSTRRTATCCRPSPPR